MWRLLLRLKSSSFNVELSAMVWFSSYKVTMHFKKQGQIHEPETLTINGFNSEETNEHCMT